MAFPGLSFSTDGKARSSVLHWQKRFKNSVSIAWKQLLSHLTIRQKISYGYALLVGIVILGTGTGLFLEDYYQQQAVARLAHAEEQENLFRSLKITVIEAQEHQQQLPLLLNNSKQFEYEYSQLQERITKVKELLVKAKITKVSSFDYSAQEAADFKRSIIVASMLLSIAIARAISSYISRAVYPLKAVTKVTQRVTEETNFNRQVPSTTKDEIGQLITSLNQLLPQVANDTQEVKQTTAELERFFNLSLDMFCIAGFNGYFQRLNSAFETHLGYTPKEERQ